MKQKGFTLVELLAVIVILAIIAVIAIPKILNIVEDSKKNAAKSSALGYIDAVEKKIATNLTTSNNNNITTGAYTINELKEKNVRVSGAAPSEGWLIVSNNKVVSYSFKINGYYINPDGENIYKVIVTKNGSIADKPKCIPGGAIACPVSFAADSWQTIAKAVKDDNIDMYNIGDTKEINMGTFGTHTIRLANKTNCTLSSQTACGFVVEFADIISERAMNPTIEGGWPASQLRQYLNNNIYNALPNDLKSIIIDTNVVSGHKTGIYNSVDKLYLLLPKEVYGVTPQAWGNNMDSVNSETRQLDYYRINNTTSENAPAAIKKYNGTDNLWWSRSLRRDNRDESYLLFTETGTLWDRAPSYTHGISPAFRIG